eukprot:CAMPEP_0117062252 /NCGR_PEP_ID=MMETSP0472-20121206/43366_1 /TAXON_ID=693140 ORGANISM="Tiarina fusus, Strain LIS" /NCGR_SAMPLE_ID=MMETSP0472 /ASSEMBLY_ACC=CAM_ASM_000603 /LENGTH=57 /DNA_ID=CAMNT_0004781303 /DNA_START=176 /DNA_END=349 /DNA_ORIENTATION=-
MSNQPVFWGDQRCPVCSNVYGEELQRVRLGVGTKGFQGHVCRVPFPNEEMPGAGNDR